MLSFAVIVVVVVEAQLQLFADFKFQGKLRGSYIHCLHFSLIFLSTKQTSNSVCTKVTSLDCKEEFQYSQNVKVTGLIHSTSISCYHHFSFELWAAVKKIRDRMLSSALKVDLPQSYFLKRNTSLKIQPQNGFSQTLKTVDLRYLAVLSIKRKRLILPQMFSCYYLYHHNYAHLKRIRKDLYLLELLQVLSVKYLTL